MATLTFVVSALVAVASVYLYFHMHHATPPWTVTSVTGRWPGKGRHPYKYPFMTVDAGKAASGRYDYIVVGGGTAGCTFATTLSAKYKVLVIERGGSPYGNPEIEEASNFGKPLGETDKYTSIAQSVPTEDGVTVARARVLGGATTLNAGFYSRASSEYIKDMGWDKDSVKEAYEWVEKRNAFRPYRLSKWSNTLREALLHLRILPYHGYTVEHLPGTKISASSFDNHGKRHTAADFLALANPHNIVVLLNSTVSRILFHGNTPGGGSCGCVRARGVELRGEDGKMHQVDAGEEVIVSAGSIGTPQVLMLSGVGPADHLRQMNIPVVLDLPGVGNGISDSPRATVAVQSPIPLEQCSIQVVGILNGSQTYIESSSFVQESKKSSDNVYQGVMFEKLAFPVSRGVIRLKSKDPRDNPSVRYNYYKEAIDLKRCVDGSRMLAKILETPALQHYMYPDTASGHPKYKFLGPTIPQSSSDDTALAKFCKDTLNTMWHFHGGCHVGSVVDTKYRLIGVPNLRVVDGSTFKDGPGTNPQATTMMLGRYVAKMIMHERCGGIFTL